MTRNPLPGRLAGAAAGDDRDTARVRADLAASDRFRQELPVPRQHRLAVVFAALRHRGAAWPSRG